MNCIRCKKPLNWSSTKWSIKDCGGLGITPPSNMTEQDRLCFACGESIKQSAKGDEAGAKRETDAQNYQLNVKAVGYKTKWNKNGIIQFKNERIAILKRGIGKQVEFIVAFDELTKEGYRMMAQDDGSEAHSTGFSGGINSYYYFQKIDAVSVGHEKIVYAPEPKRVAPKASTSPI